jgi:hypothetical protein
MYRVAVPGLGAASPGPYFFAGTIAGFVLKFPVLRLLGVEHAKNRLDPVARAKRRRSHVYLVVDDFGRNGRIFREADIEATDLDTVVADLLDGQ